MNYLDYLPTHGYAELPVEVKQEISEAEYDRRRQLVNRLAPPNDELPPALRTAYRTTIANHKRPSRIPRWLLAASWLLTLAIGSAWVSQKPVTHYVHLPPKIRTQRVIEVRTDTIFAPAPAPQIVVVRDTVYRDVTDAPGAFRSVAVTPASLSLLVSSTTE
jgi:hypothetical protein